MVPYGRLESWTSRCRVPLPIARLNFWRFLPLKRFSFVHCPATFRESKRVAIRSLRRKWRASKGMFLLPHAILAPSHARTRSDNALSRFLIAFSLSVCPCLLILPYRRTKGESDKIRHDGPASETSRRDPDPQGLGGASATALDHEHYCRAGLLSVHPLGLPHFPWPLPECQVDSGASPGMEADEEVAVSPDETNSAGGCAMRLLIGGDRAGRERQQKQTLLCSLASNFPTG